MRFTAFAKATLAVISWGLTFIATKVALQFVSPSTVVFLRFGIGVIVSGMVMLPRGYQYKIPIKDYRYFALLGLIGITFHQWLQSTGLVTSKAATTAWIVATTPIFMALLGWIFMREKMVFTQLLGIFIAAFGVIVVVTQGNLKVLFSSQVGAPGDFLILISAPNWAVFSLLSRYGLRKYPASMMLFYVMLFGWAFTTILFIWQSGFQQLSRLALEGWIAIVFLGFFGSGLAYIFWYDALQVLPIAQTGAFVYLEPFITVIAAALLLSEPVGFTSLTGGFAILVGVWLVNSVPVLEKK